MRSVTVLAAAGRPDGGQEEQMKVSPFHTITPEDCAGHRNVYHDNSSCCDGKRIKPEHKVSGTGDRPKCDECKTLD